MTAVELQRRRLLGAGVAWAGSASIGGLASSQVQAAPAALGDSVRWPTVTLLDGQVVGGEHWRDQATLVVFFATHCPYCQRHNQHLEKLVRATRGQPLRVIAAALDKSAAPVQAYLERHRYSFAVTLDARALHEALTPRKVIPLTCVIDRAGRLREVIPGEMFEDDVLGLAKWARA
jgi:thiol-disulfide isomerase/thioredoxin